MKIHIITVSNKYPAWAVSCFEQYSNRYVSNCAILLKQVKPISPNSNRSNDIVISKRAEASKIRNLIPKNSILIALESRGRKFSTKQFSNEFQSWMQVGKNPCFIIGGAEGLAQDIQDDAQTVLSLSSFTLAHPIALMVLMEQIYRVLSIINKHPYHRV